MQHKTIDGKPILMSVSGFSEYNTSQKQESVNKPVPILSAADLLDVLKGVYKLFASSEIKQLIEALQFHMSADNPHNTNLSDFTEEVVHIFYAKYKELGGTLSLEEYVNNLFLSLRIATLEEMQEPSVDPLLLISVGGAKNFMSAHEADPNAHSALFEKLLPGSPIQYNPAFAMSADIGVASTWSTYHPSIYDTEEVVEWDRRPYSFVNPAGYIEYAPLYELPIHHIEGIPYIPCFEYRENTLLDSEGLSILMEENVVKEVQTVWSPTKESKTIAIRSKGDLFPVEHNIILEEVKLEYRKPQTFSVFAKAGTCRYLSISYVDMAASEIVTRGVYDLVTGKHVLMNHMDRYRSDIEILGNGWVRCSFSMLHEIGQTSDIKLTFFKDATSEALEDIEFTFIGSNEVCGYLWGIQLEEGFIASPYIPTTDKPAYRNAISISIPLEEQFTKSNFNTLSVSMLTPKVSHFTERSVPVAVLQDIEDSTLMSIYKQFDNQVKFTIYDFTSSPSIRFYPILGTNQITTASITTNNDKISFQLNALGADAPASDYNPMKIVHLGHDNNNVYLNGYITNVLLYDKGLTYSEILFLHGDIIDEQ